MVTQVEEQQTKEFLKRAEIRTMKKDLQKLREVDALGERDKIVQIKTLDEQLEAKQKKQQVEDNKNVVEKAAREQVLQRNAVQEREAEKNVKEYASEEQRQQMFLLESKRLELDNKVKEIDEKKDPSFKLQKNTLLIERDKIEKKLKEIVDQEKKLQDEQKVIVDKDQTTTIPSERKALEQRKWELDDQIQEIEKKRWEVEKQVKAIEDKIALTDRSAENLVTERNTLQQQILGIDKSLRDIYSGVISTEEDKRHGKLEEQRMARESVAKSRLDEKERVQRKQWIGSSTDQTVVVPVPSRQRLNKSLQAEEENRKKFIQNVENWAAKEDQKQQNQADKI